MTTASGGPGDQPTSEGAQPSSGAYEAPPLEQTPAFPPPPPAYGGYAPPNAPGYGYPGGYPPPLEGGYPPPPPGNPGSYPPPPEYGVPYPGGYGPPMTPPAGTNSLAVFSMVASVVGLLCGVGSIIGIVLGVISLKQIKSTGQQGHGLAVAGILVGAVSLAISVVWMIFAFTNS